MTEVQVEVLVEGEAADSGVHDLRRRLVTEPELRGRIRVEGPNQLPPGAMGLAGDTLLALLEPGGIICTVTATRPDGTQITITTTRIRNLDAQQRNEFIREITAALQETDSPDRQHDASEGTGQRHDQENGPDRQSDEADGPERQ